MFLQFNVMSNVTIDPGNVSWTIEMNRSLGDVLASLVPRRSVTEHLGTRLGMHLLITDRKIEDQRLQKTSMSSDSTCSGIPFRRSWQD